MCDSFHAACAFQPVNQSYDIGFCNDQVLAQILLAETGAAVLLQDHEYVELNVGEREAREKAIGQLLHERRGAHKAQQSFVIGARERLFQFEFLLQFHSGTLQSKAV